MCGINRLWNALLQTPENIKMPKQKATSRPPKKSQITPRKVPV